MKFIGVNEQYFETNLIGVSEKDSIEHIQSSELILLWFDEDGNELIIEFLVVLPFTPSTHRCLSLFSIYTTPPPSCPDPSTCAQLDRFLSLPA